MSRLDPIATASVPEELDTPSLLHLYRQMVLLRRFERTVQALYKAGEVPGFIHLYTLSDRSAGTLPSMTPDEARQVFKLGASASR